MKRLTTFILALLLFFGTVSFAQVAINTDDSQPDASAMLDVKSTTQGFLPPRMTTAERDGISSPVEGLLIYNTDESCLNIYVGLGWRNLCDIVADGDVINPQTGKIWMDRNLGASQVATSSDDYLAYGSLFQWGRLADGHEIINWTSSTGSDGAEQSNETSSLSTSDVPGHGNFIRASSDPFDWRSPQRDTLWQGVSGTNNPCPAGYRLPTDTELENERLSWAPNNNSTGAYGSPLKLPVAGGRDNSGGSLANVGSFGYYWSSTVSGIYSRALAFYSSNASMHSYYRANGFSLRCLKD